MVKTNVREDSLLPIRHESEPPKYFSIFLSGIAATMFSLSIYLSDRSIKAPKQTESNAKAKEEIMMNTNMKENSMKELELNELEQVNGGILPILIGVGTLALGGALVFVYKKFVE